jgi:magnesium transporter
MRLFTRKLGDKAGLPPGSVVHVGDASDEEVRITVLDYNADTYTETEVTDLSKLELAKASDTVTWVNVSGIHDTATIKEFGDRFEIHPLALEDIVNTAQRPKVEEFDDYLFIVLKMFYPSGDGASVLSEQVSLILGSSFVISFQEVEGDIFDPVRERIRKGKGQMRRRGADYLAYALIDGIVDGYFAVLEALGEQVEQTEAELLENPSTATMQTMHAMRREIILLRKSVWPLREIISTLQREELSLIQEGTLRYLRDVYDHTIQVIDTVESFRDIVSGMLDTYLTSMSNKMNEIMKVLTIIATIFIPLTFVAGIYGMNFEHMPELRWSWAYPLGFWIAILIVGSGMALYFRRKTWL